MLPLQTGVLLSTGGKEGAPVSSVEHGSDPGEPMLGGSFLREEGKVQNAVARQGPDGDVRIKNMHKVDVCLSHASGPRAASDRNYL